MNKSWVYGHKLGYHILIFLILLSGKRNVFAAFGYTFRQFFKPLAHIVHRRKIIINFGRSFGIVTQHSSGYFRGFFCGHNRFINNSCNSGYCNLNSHNCCHRNGHTCNSRPNPLKSRCNLSSEGSYFFLLCSEVIDLSGNNIILIPNGVKGFSELTALNSCTRKSFFKISTAEFLLHLSVAFQNIILFLPVVVIFGVIIFKPTEQTTSVQSVFSRFSFPSDNAFPVH